MPVVRTDGRSLARSVYGHVITKFSGMSRLPHFLSYGAPPTRALARAGGAPLLFSLFNVFIASSMVFVDGKIYRMNEVME